MTARELADPQQCAFRDLAAKLNISNSDFIRTTEPRHCVGCRKSGGAWKRRATSTSRPTGWYSVRDEAYFDAERADERRTAKTSLPRVPKVSWVEEPSYFFRLSAFQDRLLKLYEDNPDFIAPKERRNEVMSFVGPRTDLSISRTTFDWGIPVPDGTGPCDVCVDRRADQLHHWRRLPFNDQGRTVQALLAG